MKKNYQRIILLAGLTFLFLSTYALANNVSVIYDNGAPNLTDSYNLGTRVYADDFTLSNDALWTDVHFWFDQPRSPTDVSLWDGSLTYYLYSDDNGSPDQILESNSVDGIIPNYTGRTPSFGGVTYYEYLASFDLIDPFIIDGGSTYWLGLQLFDTSNSANAVVRWSGTDGSGDSLFYYYNINNPGTWFPQSVGTGKDYGLAFQLTGREIAPIPEPSTFILLGGGLIGLAFTVHRRKK